MTTEWPPSGNMQQDTWRLPSPVQSTERTSMFLDRTLLVACGATANAVARTAQELSRRWLDCEPPLAVVHWGADRAGADAATDAPAFTLALDTLAGQSLAAALASASYTFRERDAITLWLLVSLPGAEPARTMGTPSPADDMPAKLSPTAALQIVETIEQAAWQRARLRTDAHLFLLADAHEQHDVADWARTWPAPGRLYVAGPVNHTHVRLAPDVWQAHVAAGICALLWGAFPSHALHCDAGTVSTLGATVWTPPLTPISSWLATRSAYEAVLLLNTPALPVGGHPILANNHEPPGLHVEVEAWVAELYRAQSTPPPPLLLQATLPALRTLPDTLADVTKRQRATQAETLRRNRTAWIERRLAAWDTAAAAQFQSHVAPEAGLPCLPAYQAILNRRLATAVKEQVLVDSALERAAERVAAAQQREAQSGSALRATCDLFPPNTITGWLSAALQPWRWLRWLHAWLTLLPLQLRDAQHATAEYDAAQCDEGDWHTVRQAVLAIQQSMRRDKAAADSVADWLAAVAKALDARLTALMHECTPWTQALLEQLWSAVARSQVERQLTTALMQQSLAGWAATPVENATDVWIAYFGATDDTLPNWDALHFLICGLTGTLDPPTGAVAPVLEAWLQRAIQAATPLWPQPPTAQRADATAWVLLPRGRAVAKHNPPAVHAPAIQAAPQGQHHSWGSTVHYVSLFEAWCNEQRGFVELSESSGEALAVLQLLVAPIPDMLDAEESTSPPYSKFSHDE